MTETVEDNSPLDLSYVLPAPDAALEALLALGDDVAPEPETGALRVGVCAEATLASVADGEAIFALAGGVTGRCPLAELKVPGRTGSIEPGQPVTVLLDLERADGSWSVSAAKAAYLAEAQSLARMATERTVVPARIMYPTRGGFSVLVGTTRAFLPGRESGIAMADAVAAAGTECDVEIVGFDPDSGELRVSRERLWKSSRDQQRTTALENVVEGAVIVGRVKSIKPFGIFVDIGGVDGMVHVSELALDHVADPASVVRIGDEIEVKVVEVDRAKGRIALSRRELLAAAAGEKVAGIDVGSLRHGVVRRLTDFGAFIELEPGVEGLCHISELSWSGRVTHPSEVLAEGQEIEVRVLSVDGTRRIGLSLRQVAENPWTGFIATSPVGTNVQGTIRRIEDYGLFVEVAPGVEGLCHVGELTWTGRPRKPSDVSSFTVGGTITVRVLEADLSRQRLALSLRQVDGDPWDNAGDKLTIGTIYEARVTRIEDNAAYIELAEGLEGRIYISEISNDRIDSVRAALRIGQTVRATTIKVERERRRIDCSIKGVETIEQADIPRQFADAGAEASLNPLAEALRKRNASN